MFKTLTYKVIGLFILLQLIYTQDPPPGFEYNQSTLQAFYFFFNPSFSDQAFGIENLEDKENGVYDFGEYFSDAGNENGRISPSLGAPRGIFWL